MLSFILIGKNEEKTIYNTIISVLNSVSDCAIEKYEIIYVDSKSDDKSIDIVRDFQGVKIFQITGETNAAIARNVGANEALGDILCFLDADMELQADFISEVIKDRKLIYPFVSGQLKNYFYDNSLSWTLLGTNYLHKNLNKDKFEVTTGGYFIINRDTWFSVGGMKTKYRRSQDLDIGLRLAKKGVKLLRIKKLMVKHHTIDYVNKERKWRMLFDGGIFFNSVLIRDHLTNKHFNKIIFRRNFTLLILIFSILSSFFTVYSLFIYPILLFIRIFFQNRLTNNFFERLIYFLVVDILCLFGLFFFFPKEYEIQYSKSSFIN